MALVSGCAASARFNGRLLRHCATAFAVYLAGALAAAHARAAQRARAGGLPRLATGLFGVISACLPPPTTIAAAIAAGYRRAAAHAREPARGGRFLGVLEDAPRASDAPSASDAVGRLAAWHSGAYGGGSVRLTA